MTLKSILFVMLILLTRSLSAVSSADLNDTGLTGTSFDAHLDTVASSSMPEGSFSDIQKLVNNTPLRIDASNIEDSNELNMDLENLQPDNCYILEKDYAFNDKIFYTFARYRNCFGGIMHD